MADLPRIDMGNPPFTRMLAKAFLHGGLFGLALQLAYVRAMQLWTAPPSWPGHVPLEAFVLGMLSYSALTGVVITFIGVAFMAPTTGLLTWPLYRRGVKSYAAYITIGVIVGLLTALAVRSLLLGGMPDGVPQVFDAWIAASSAFGGWSFAHQLSRQIKPQRSD